jgi:hypothetical protein
VTLKFADNLTNLPERSNKIFDELVELASDLSYVEDGYAQLLIAARDFTPKLDQHEIVRTNPTQTNDPGADVAFVQHKVRLALANLDKSIPLLSQRRDEIARLLR